MIVDCLGVFGALMTAVWGIRASTDDAQLTRALPAIITKITALNIDAQAYVGPHGSTGVIGILESIIIAHMDDMMKAFQAYIARPLSATSTPDTVKLATTSLAASLNTEFMRSTPGGSSRGRKYEELESELNEVRKTKGTLKLDNTQLGILSGRLDESCAILSLPSMTIPKKSAEQKAKERKAGSPSSSSQQRGTSSQQRGPGAPSKKQRRNPDVRDVVQDFQDYQVHLQVASPACLLSTIGFPSLCQRSKCKSAPSMHRNCVLTKTDLTGFLKKPSSQSAFRNAIRAGRLNPNDVRPEFRRIIG